jgi:hypothetical protein
MSSEAVHIECANRTQSTIAYLLTELDSNSPWIATAAFYKALHVVEAVFANDPSIRHTSDHSTRERTLKMNRKFDNIYRHYSPLSRASLNARYLMSHSCFDDYMPPSDVVDVLLKHNLKQVENSARKFLKSPDSLISIDVAFS